MNKKLFKVEAVWESRVVGEDGEEVKAKVVEFLRQHPEELTVSAEYDSDVDLLEEWEVKK